MPTGIKDVRADDLIVAVLKEAVRRASTHDLALTDDRALRLGCPAMWDGQQRRRLLKLAQAAGLPATLESFVDEPVAAGIAWLASGRVKTSEPMRVVVFDMGGGTLDIAVLDVRGVRHQDVSVLAAIGVAEAGDSLDEAIAEDLEYVLAAAGVDVDSLSDPQPGPRPPARRRPGGEGRAVHERRARRRPAAPHVRQHRRLVHPPTSSRTCSRRRWTGPNCACRRRCGPRA